jgi:hypothetical protein
MPASVLFRVSVQPPLGLGGGSIYVAKIARDLIPSTDEQLELFSSPAHAVSEAADKINDRWGEFVITPALMMGMDDIILDRISFGGVKELQEIYA